MANLASLASLEDRPELPRHHPRGPGANGIATPPRSPQPGDEFAPRFATPRAGSPTVATGGHDLWGAARGLG